MIEELAATPLEIGYEKTLHIIFPTEVKYCNAGNDHILAEKSVLSPILFVSLQQKEIFQVKRIFQLLQQILSSIHIPSTIVIHPK